MFVLVLEHFPKPELACSCWLSLQWLVEGPDWLPGLLLLKEVCCAVTIGVPLGTSGGFQGLSVQLTAAVTLLSVLSMLGNNRWLIEGAAMASCLN